jgi:outer membrane lipoprotein carrier protein
VWKQGLEMNKLVLGLCMSLFSMIILADDSHKAVEVLRLFFNTTESMSASFIQTNLDEQERITEQSEGEFVLLKPDSFSWNYQRPFVQKIVATGNKVWFYDVDLEQVTIKKIDKLMGFSPLLFLTGGVDLAHDFRVEIDSINNAVVWLRVIPKEENSGFEFIRLGLEQGQLFAMEFGDNFGRKTKLNFIDVEVNSTVDSSLFVFNIPAGVDVFEE